MHVVTEMVWLVSHIHNPHDYCEKIKTFSEV